MLRAVERLPAPSAPAAAHQRGDSGAAGAHSHPRAQGAPEVPPQGTLTLPFAERQKSRLRTHLDDGREVALVLQRGHVLRAGDRLRTECGAVLEVRAADEELACVRSDDPWALARASYHLGNRHVPLAIERGALRFLRDHVLEDMVRSLGLAVTLERGPFEPEAGAYAHSH